MFKLDGQKIVSVTPHYEHLFIRDDQDNNYFMKYEELLTMFNEFLFDVEKKHTHIHPIIPDVELLYDKEKYDTVNDN